MLTVRFQNGLAIQYNTATYAFRADNGYTDLYTRKDGEWVAQVPTAQCVIEAVRACRVYNAVDEQTRDRTERELRATKRRKPAVLARPKRGGR